MKTFHDRWTGTPPAGTERIAFQRHPGDAEAAAAVGGLHEQTISVRMFAPGDTVRCPRAFEPGDQLGTVVGPVKDRHWGACWHVDTREGRLLMHPDELERV